MAYLVEIKEIVEQLININKNLEKIANNTEKDNIKQMQDLFHKGEYLDPYHVDINLDTIICNQNKDGRVDKNIISD